MGVESAVSAAQGTDIASLFPAIGETVLWASSAACPEPFTAQAGSRKSIALGDSETGLCRGRGGLPQGDVPDIA